MIKEGDRAPEFCLESQEKKEVCLKNYKGQWVVVYFYPRDNTPGCTTEAKDFSMNVEEFKKKKATILGISTDDIASHIKFMEKHDLKITLLSDPTNEVHNKYGTWVKKSMYGKEYYGTERSTFLINPEGKIEKVWRKVKVPGHVEEIKLLL